MTLLLVTMFFAVAFDAGLWFFDHRTAQNQAEAAALAGAQELPSLSTTAANQAVNDWLTKNGAEPCAPGCVTYQDNYQDAAYDTIRVEVERESPGIFASLSGVSVVDISAAATATTGPVDSVPVMPWSVIPPDPTCDTPGEFCDADFDGDGQQDPGDCFNVAFQDCPWGLSPERLYGFKSGGGGNTGIIDACGNGASNYRDCITGESISGFFTEGEYVVVGLQGGNLGVNTRNALATRYAAESPTWPCDVAATPDNLSGADPSGYALANQRLDTGPALCQERVVFIPILESMPSNGCGNCSLKVVGVASFYIASWNRSNPVTHDAYGTATQQCSNNVSSNGNFACGMVWGYLMEDRLAPQELLQTFGDTDNPFAPLFIALVD
jgi:hypothetical protein